MTVTMRSPAEAFLTVGLLVLAADGRLSREECAAVFNSMMALAIFEGEAGFAARRFLATMMQQSHSSMVEETGPIADDAFMFSEALVEDLIAGVRRSLPRPLREPALVWALQLAAADGCDAREQALLLRIARALNVEEAVVHAQLQRLQADVHDSESIQEATHA
ncbi:MAG: TerB family tellurite resistance protein [Anaerolineae bacterium]|nr:TerB family tellurite resistance protein [Anaerolineae bacterium]